MVCALTGDLEFGTTGRLFRSSSDTLGSSRRRYGFTYKLSTLESGIVAMATMAMVTMVMLVMASIGETHSGHNGFVGKTHGGNNSVVGKTRSGNNGSESLHALITMSVEGLGVRSLFDSSL